MTALMEAILDGRRPTARRMPDKAPREHPVRDRSQARNDPSQAARRPINLARAFELGKRQQATTVATLIYRADHLGWPPLDPGPTFSDRVTDRNAARVPNLTRLRHESAWPITALGWTGEAVLTVDLSRRQYLETLDRMPAWVQTTVRAFLQREPVPVGHRTFGEWKNPLGNEKVPVGERPHTLYLAPPDLVHQLYADQLAGWKELAPLISRLSLDLKPASDGA